MKKWIILDYKNGNKAIIEKSEYEKEQRKEYGINTTAPAYHDEAIVGIVESEAEPTWDNLKYDSETGEYILRR